MAIVYKGKGIFSFVMKKLVKRVYKFRIFPSKFVAKKMEKVLDSCRFLYNAELEYEKQLWFFKREYADKVVLNNLVPDWKAINPDLKRVHSQVLQNVSDRLCKAFENFFRRVKIGEQAGFPRFKSVERYNSFAYPQSGFKLEGNNLKLSKIGLVSIKLHRRIKGKIKTLMIKRTCTNKWFACFGLEEEKEIRQHKSDKIVGIDVGLNSFYADSEGNKICNPRWLRKSEERLKLLQRQHSKKIKGSRNKNKSRLRIAKLHEKVVNQRNDFLHKESRKLADIYSLIVVEKLSIKNMVKNQYLAKSINDAGWRRFLQFLSYKAEEAGGRIVKVDARGTSQRCICGNEVRKSLAVRTHKCKKCGRVLDRDVMSTMLIKASALEEYKNTAGTAGINACGDVPLGTSMKQEYTSNVRNSG